VETKDHSNLIAKIEDSRVEVDGTLQSSLPRGSAALIVAHPGHELRVHGWLESAHPVVMVFSDGSGRSGHSRLESTTRILARAGAHPGKIYGRFTDAEIYAALLNRDPAPFINLAAELSETLVREQVSYVVGDAVEGYNPAHDVCRYVINAAVALSERAARSPIANFDFLVVGQPKSCPDHLRTQAIWLKLSDEALRRELAAARAYSEIAADVDSALAEMGDEAFRVECLRPVARGPITCGLTGEAPFYERYGEEQVAAGHYKQVLRYSEHVAPLIDALNSHVSSHES
jgi:AcrR family transcriptional regulator